MFKNSEDAIHIFTVWFGLLSNLLWFVLISIIIYIFNQTNASTVCLSMQALSDVNTVSSTQRPAPATVWFQRCIVITKVFYWSLYYSKYRPKCSVKKNADDDIKGRKYTSSYWEKCFFLYACPLKHGSLCSLFKHLLRYLQPLLK